MLGNKTVSRVYGPDLLLSLRELLNIFYCAGINRNDGFERLGMTGKEYVQKIFDKLYHLIHSN